MYTNYQLLTTDYELGGFTQRVLFEQPSPAKCQAPTGAGPATDYALPTFPFIAACGTKTPLFAAFNGLKTRALYVILSLIKNISSVPARTHHERSFDHVGSTTRTQAERQQEASAHKLPVKWESRTHRCAAKLKRTLLSLKQSVSPPVGESAAKWNNSVRSLPEAKRSGTTQCEAPPKRDYSPFTIHHSPFTNLQKSWASMNAEATLYSFRFVFLERIPLRTLVQPVQCVWRGVTLET
jgi:hypothetical protein